MNAETSARGAAAVLKLLAALHTAKGLAALHAHGMVHGDLKADNVMASASASGICYKVSIARKFLPTSLARCYVS